MLLAAASHQLIEDFHRHFNRDENLRLPRVHLYGGRIARWLTHAFHISAITFGRHVFVNPELIGKDASGNLTAPAWLLAHETTHVLQYEAAGFTGFLITYLSEYWRGLWHQKKWGQFARLEAYNGIKAECEAREAEIAYAAWAEIRAGGRRERG